MNKNKWDINDVRLIEAVNEGLENEIDGLSSSTLERLQQARMVAVYQEYDDSWVARAWNFITGNGQGSIAFAPVSVAMLVAVLSMSLLLSPASPLRQDINAQQDILLKGGEHSLSEMDVLMSNEDIEFLENLEVYEWLAAEYG